MGHLCCWELGKGVCLLLLRQLLFRGGFFFVVVVVEVIYLFIFLFFKFFCRYTNEFIVLRDDEVAVITPNGHSLEEKISEFSEKVY